MSRRPWTETELQHLLRDYADTPTKVLAKRLNRPINSVYQKAHNLSLKKSAEFLASEASGRLVPGDERGEAGRFAAGKTPWNKGRKGFDAGGRSHETRFKPGDRRGKAAKLYQPIGTERITKDGYRQRKVNDDMPLQRRWKMVQVIVWEEHNGPVPDGYAVTFRDGDRQNCAIDNLALISRVELMKRNTVQRFPAELREVMRMKASVTRQINKRAKA